MKTFEKVLGHVTDKMSWVAQWTMVACVVFTMAEVIRRGLIGLPISGHWEVVCLMSAVILSMGIAYLTFVRGHVWVGILIDRLRPQRQAIFDLVNGAISLGFTILLTLAMAKFGILTQTSHWTTGILGISLHIFVFLMSAALALTCVVLVRDMAKAVIMLRTGGGA